MSEITKLYENAGIKGEWRDYRVKNGKIERVLNICDEVLQEVE